jgi:hypothetical protein
VEGKDGRKGWKERMVGKDGRKGGIIIKERMEGKRKTRTGV